MRYLTLTQTASSTAFISQATRHEWANRIVRSPERTGPVLPLGADGLGLEHQSWRPDRRTFVCIGSLDGRRNQHLIIRAFRRLWSQGHDPKLVIYGHAFDASHTIAREVITAAADDPRIVHYATATDLDIMEGLRRARATLYVSSSDGFGLPPVESLHAGIPTISTVVPSLHNLPSKGQLRLQSVAVDAVEQAVRLICDDDVAASLWEEAKGLQLPTWQDFAELVATG